MKQKPEKIKVDLPGVKVAPAGDRQFFEMSTDEIAELLGVSPRTIRDCRQRHGLPSTGRDSYDARLVYAWTVAAIKGTPRAPGTPAAPTAPGELTPRDALIFAQRERCEVETALLRSTLLPRGMVFATMNQVGAIVDDEFEKMASATLLAEIAGITDPDRIQSRLFAASRISRSEIARRMLELSERTASGEAFAGDAEIEG